MWRRLAGALASLVVCLGLSAEASAAWQKVWGPTDKVIIDSQAGAVYAVPPPMLAIKGV